MRPPAKPPGPPPDESALRQAALTHLARYSTTQAGLLRVLGRRIDRWARAAEAAPEQVTACQVAAREVVVALAGMGAVDDAAFAAGRARSLHRAGRSRRAIAAHLQAKGVPAELVALPDDAASELSAAILYMGRRRIGPFRLEPDPAQRQRDLARLARAGFGADIAMRALDFSHADAETLLLEARRG
jgi:regulatory protein